MTERWRRVSLGFVVAAASFVCRFGPDTIISPGGTTGANVWVSTGPNRSFRCLRLSRDGSCELETRKDPRGVTVRQTGTYQRVNAHGADGTEFIAQWSQGGRSTFRHVDFSAGGMFFLLDDESNSYVEVGYGKFSRAYSMISAVRDSRDSRLGPTR